MPLSIPTRFWLLRGLVVLFSLFWYRPIVPSAFRDNGQLSTYSSTRHAYLNFGAFYVGLSIFEFLEFLGTHFWIKAELFNLTGADNKKQGWGFKPNARVHSFQISICNSCSFTCFDKTLHFLAYNTEGLLSISASHTWILFKCKYSMVVFYISKTLFAAL